MKLDILVIASHPDDAELSCSGTIAMHVAKGHKVGVLDLTLGELGTRGTPEIRIKESEKASQVLGLTTRINLGLPDGFFMNDKESRIRVAEQIRAYKPEIVLANAIEDRHPDHARAAQLSTDACFIAGLTKVKTFIRRKEQKAWRPKAVYHYIQSNYIVPDFIVDISRYWNVKKNSIQAYRSQFYNPGSNEPETFISKPEFMDFIEARCKQWGHAIGVKYGEGFTVERHMGIRDLFDIL